MVFFSFPFSAGGGMFFDGSLSKNNEDGKRIRTRSSRVALGGNFGGASQPGLLLPPANLRMEGSTCTGTYPQLYTTQRTSRTYRGPGTIFTAPWGRCLQKRVGPLHKQGRTACHLHPGLPEARPTMGTQFKVCFSKKEVTLLS